MIPGFGESISQKRYSPIVKSFKSNEFNVVPVSIDWKYRTMSDYVDQFLDKVKEIRQFYLFGFSFGAMVSVISSSRIQPRAQILCSLSPYFKEDFKYIPESWHRFIGKKRVEDFRALSFNNLASKVKCKTFILAGTLEAKEVGRRVEEAHKRIANSELILVDGAKHDVAQKEYAESLDKLIAKL